MLSRLLRLCGALTVAALLLGSVAACYNPNANPNVTVWRISIEEVSGSVQDAYAQRFKELIEKRTNGKVKVVVYPIGTLGSSDQTLELVYSNTLQFAMSSPGHLGKTIKELQFFSLHFLFSDIDEVNKRLLRYGGPVHKNLGQLYADKGFRLLSIYPEGWQVWTLNKKVTTPKEMEGVKMRVMTSPLLIDLYQSYGASPVPLPYTEVYSALQLNMIDGQVNPVFAIEEMKFYKVTDYMIFPKASLFVTSMISSNRFFNSLSSERKALVLRTIRDLNDFIFERQQEYNRKRLKIIQKENQKLDKDDRIQLITLTPAQREAFRKASLPVRERFFTRVGGRSRAVVKMFLKQVQQEEARYKAQSRPTTSPAARP